MRLRLATLVTLAMITAGCGGAQQSGFGEAERRGSQLLTEYFPSSSFAAFRGSDFFLALVAFHLSTMNEQPLFMQGSDYAVRVLVMTDGTWGDEVVSIVQRGDAATATYKHFRHGNKDGLLASGGAQRIDKPITTAKFVQLKELIAERKFMELGNEPDALVIDGPTWVVEVYDGNRYHAALGRISFSEPVNADVVRLTMATAGVTLLNGER